MKLLAPQQPTPQHNPAAPDFTPAIPTSEASPAITSTAASSVITSPAVTDISSASPVMHPASKTVAHRPPTLRADDTFQTFRQWRRSWDDYATMVDLQKLAREKQLIQLRMSVSLDVQRTLEHTLGIAHDTSLTVDQVLNELQKHFKNQRNEALRRRELLCCKQKEGETFSDFYVRLKDLPEEVDLCSGDPVTCAEAQLKMILLMGVKDEELVQHLISTHADASLQEMVTCCRSFEATKDAASAIHSSPSQLCAVSSYKKKQRDKTTRSSPPRSQNKPSSPNSDSCRSCNRRLDTGKCPAKEAICMNCGCRGHWPRTARCPAKHVTCNSCHKMGHFAKVCRTGKSDYSKGPASRPKYKNCRRVSADSKTPQPVCILLTYGQTSSRLQMLPDTGADVTIIGKKHLEQLKIPCSDLQPLESTTTFTADGSEMAPALGFFQAKPQLGKKTCKGKIQVHDGVTTPLLSYRHCQELAIISPQFPKPILEVKHANWCAESHLPDLPTPSAARKYFLQEYNDVLLTKQDLKEALLQPMTGGPMQIHLKEGAVPLAIHTPRPIPFTIQQKVKEELESMECQGIIAPVSRPTHPSPTPFDAVRRVTPSSRYFTKVDDLCGYWQLELAEEDQHLTTFITPYGRYKHRRGPMGFSATGDTYCSRGDIALQGMQRCVKVVDDILLYDDDFKTHIQQVDQMLRRCRKNGITLNRDKFVIAAPSVSFCGYTISNKGIEADQDRVSAIRDFPTPANVTDLRSFISLVNQLSEFTPSIAATAQTLRPLLSPKRTFIWTADHDEAFRRVKEALSQPPVLAHFNLSLPIVLQTDASRLYGIGYALLQDHGQGRLRLVQCGSRFLTDAETRYATIELEMLAAVWATAKCKPYLIGVPNFTLMTDHRPLIPILNKYTLDTVENHCLQRLKGHISPYQFTTDENLCNDAATHLRSIVTCNTIGTVTDPKNEDADRTLQELHEAASVDPEYARLKDCVSTGFPSNRYDLHKSLLPYWKIRDSLSADGELVLHRGVEATKRRARQTVFWPGIDADIKSTVEACQPCQVMQPSQQQEPMQNDDHPTRPFESVSADFFTVAGKPFLVIAVSLAGLSSSPSNGHAEAAVKSTKYLIMKTAPSGNIDNEDFDRGLLELRNIPNATGRSPAQIFYGRPLRSCVPAHPESFLEEWQEKSEDCDRRAAAQAEQVRQRYDQHARSLPQLHVGQTVRIQDPTSLRWDKIGTVMGC
ncbi:uncharacterized protein [Penaeus vannamei]|uniref:uncharacterized protein n=1 Tax=Penaeus vannamei TaxID=6689 RepID=UPI00387F4C3D